MYGLPQTTEIKKQLPKKAIYAKFELDAQQRDSFDADINRLDLTAFVSPATVPALSEGQTVKEFYLMCVRLKRKEYNAKNIVLLSRLISQNIVFALQYEDETQLAVFHTKLISSCWKPTDETRIDLFGLNLDAVWENIIKQVGQIDVEEGRSLTEQIQADEKKAKIAAQIKTLERRLATEKQPRKKREYFEMIKNLKGSIS